MTVVGIAKYSEHGDDDDDGGGGGGDGVHCDKVDENTTGRQQSVDEVQS
jgi:hypothetical protein